MKLILMLALLAGSSWVVAQVPMIQGLILAGCLLLAICMALLVLCIVVPEVRGLVLVLVLCSQLIQHDLHHWAGFILMLYVVGLGSSPEKDPVSHL